MEFLVFTEVFQRARRRWGNAGLGGNGQFVRWTALQALGDEPWTDYLTEDLDMGLRRRSRLAYLVHPGDVRQPGRFDVDAAADAPAHRWYQDTCNAGRGFPICC